MTIGNAKLDLFLPNPFQTRLSEDPEHIRNLAASIKQEGLLQIPLGRWASRSADCSGNIELAFGHSRLAAFKLLAENDASFDTMPVAIQPLSDEEMFTRAIAENHSRKDLSPIETARAMLTYRDHFGKTSKEIGALFHLSPSAVRNKIRLLDLPEPAQEKIDQGEITEGSARSLLQLQRINPDQLDAIIEKASEKQLSSVDLERETTDAITESSTTYTLHERWLSGEPRAGRNLWLLSEWTPAIISGQKDYFEDIRKPLKSVEGFKNLSYEAFSEMQDLLIEDPLAWEQKYAAEYSPRDLEIFRVMAGHRTTCSACPLHVVKNGYHYCGFKPCWAWRKRQYEHKILSEKSKEMGIPIYARSDGKYDHLGKYDDWNTLKYKPEIEKFFDQWFAEKSDCLRLKLQSSRNPKHAFTEDAAIAVVCVGEDALQKIQDIVQSEKKVEGLSGWEISQIKQEAADKFIEVVVVPVFSVLFQAIPAGFFEWIYEEGEGDQSNLNIFTNWVLDQQLSWNEKREGPTATAEFFEEAAGVIGIDLPGDWNEKAAQYEPVFDEVGEG